MELGRYVTSGAAGHLERFTQRILLSEELIACIVYMARLEIISGEPSDTMTGQIHFNSVTYRFWPVKSMR